jgi:hypothetical protein
MKTIFKFTLVAAALLASLAGTVSATERLGHNQTVVVPKHIETQVVASTLFSEKELARWNLKPDDLVHVTVAPTTGIVDAPRGGER